MPKVTLCVKIRKVFFECGKWEGEKFRQIKQVSVGVATDEACLVFCKFEKHLSKVSGLSNLLIFNVES